MIIYDAEIVKAIPDKDGKRLDGIEYCEGWKDFDNMGISVICAYDYETDRYHVFCEDNLDDFQRLVDKTNLVIGFNNIAFDNMLCRANGIEMPFYKSWDLLSEIWQAVGLPKTYEGEEQKGFGLEDCSHINFGTKKSGNGALAPIEWQQGRIGKVIDYCLNDVRLTKDLVDMVMELGVLVHPKHVDGDVLIHIQPPSVAIVNREL